MAYGLPDTRATGYPVEEDDWNELVNNFLFLNSVFRQPLPIAGGKAPLSGIQAASYSLVESSGAAVNNIKPIIEMLSFDDSTDEARLWNFQMPRGYGVTATLKGIYKMAGGNVDKDIILKGQLAAVSPTDADMDAKVFAAANSETERVPALAETAGYFEIELAVNDSLVADDWVCLALWVDESASNFAGDFQLTNLAVDFDLAI